MPDSRSAAEKQLERIERRVKGQGGSIKFTPQVIAKLNKLEAQLRTKASGNKQLEIAFGDTKNFFSELNNLSKSDRTAKLQSIRQAAEDEFTDFFENKRSNLSEDFSTEIDRLNRDFKFADADTLDNFKKTIAGLDRDTVEAIGASFRSVVSRGLGSSGAMKAMADKIIAQRTIAADQVQGIRDVAVRNTRTSEGDRREDLQSAFKRGNETINQNELFNVKLEEQRLQDRESNILLQSNDLTGQNQLAPRVVAPEPAVTDNDPLSVRLAALNNQPNENAVNLQNKTAERRQNRINRLNLANNAR